MILCCLTLLIAACANLEPSVRDAQENCASTAALNFVCGADKPEDLARIPGTRWLIASGFNAGAGIKLIDTQSR